MPLLTSPWMNDFQPAPGAAAEEADRWRFYGSIPKKHWVKLSGRQHKILDDQASRYGLPILEIVVGVLLVVGLLTRAAFLADPAL